jgi:Nuclease-related domain
LFKANGPRDDLRSMAPRLLKLRRPDSCVVCGSVVAAGADAWWDAGARAVTCIPCSEMTAARAAVEPERSELDRGQAGASVAREYQRRKQGREARTNTAHPRIGGLLLSLRGAPQHESAFRRGELGETAVAASLEQHTADGPTIILHDRRVPGGRGNIDHIAIAPTGVFVIDAKDHKGKVSVSKPLFGAARLRIAGRDRTKLIDGLDRQVSGVRAALAANGYGDIPVKGVLCFTAADLPLLGTLKMRGHALLYRKALAKTLNADGALHAPAIEAIARTLAAVLPHA